MKWVFSNFFAHKLSLNMHGHGEQGQNIFFSFFLEFRSYRYTQTWAICFKYKIFLVTCYQKLNILQQMWHSFDIYTSCEICGAFSGIFLLSHMETQTRLDLSKVMISHKIKSSWLYFEGNCIPLICSAVFLFWIKTMLTRIRWLPTFTGIPSRHRYYFWWCAT